MNTHVERARQIADALESPDVEKTLYEQFAAEFNAWEAEQREGGRESSSREFDRLIGRGDGYTRRIVRGVTSGARAPDWGSGSNRRTEVATKMLREQPEVVAEILDENPEVHARVLDAIEERREKAETSPAPRPDRAASAQVERKFERGYFTIKDAIALMQDTAVEDPEHLRRVFSNIRSAVDFAESLLGTDDFAQVEEWLSNAS
jgi:hypothetical protein